MFTVSTMLAIYVWRLTRAVLVFTTLLHETGQGRATTHWFVQ